MPPQRDGGAVSKGGGGASGFLRVGVASSSFLVSNARVEWSGLRCFHCPRVFPFQAGKQGC